MLQTMRKGRVILLCTHFMDEADLLGDRIGIVANGRVKACGSSVFLKNKFGLGYYLYIVKQEGCVSKRVTELIGKHIKNLAPTSDTAGELAFRLPLTAVKVFGPMLRELEGQLKPLCIESYGVSITTLEEVHLTALCMSYVVCHTLHGVRCMPYAVWCTLFAARSTLAGVSLHRARVG
jgi:ABC-type uncharacterized transport system ATPase subunit